MAEKEVVFQVTENGVFTIHCSDIRVTANTVYSIIHKLVPPTPKMNTCQQSNKKGVFQLFDDGTFSIKDCSDLMELCNTVYKFIYEIINPPPNLDSIHLRRQSVLEYYRREYGSYHQIDPANTCDEGEDEIDC